VEAVHTYVSTRLHGVASQKSAVRSHCSDNSSVARERQNLSTCADGQVSSLAL